MNKKNKNRDVKAGLLLTLEVGMVHDIARLTKLIKTHGVKVGEISDQINDTFGSGLLSAEEAEKRAGQFVKRIQSLNSVIREIHELSKKMEGI